MSDFRSRLVTAFTNIANIIADQFESKPSEAAPKIETPVIESTPAKEEAPKTSAPPPAKSVEATVERACKVEQIEEPPARNKVSKNITHAQAIAIVMGDRSCTTSEIMPLLTAAGLGPQGSTDLRQHLTVILTTNQGEGKIFQRVGKGLYKVQDPSAYTKLAQQFGITTSGKAEGVASEEVVPSDPPSSSNLDTALTDLLKSVGYSTELGL